MRVRAFLLCFSAVVLLGRVSARDVARAQKLNAPTGIPVCTADQFSLGTDDENGNFDGMSHSGTLLVLRNLGSNACRMATAPLITLYAKTTKLNVKFTPTAKGAGSVIVAAGAELTSSLRWVSNDVYDPSVCVTATSLHVQVAGKDLSTVTSHQLCGQKGTTIQADMSLLAVDPVYRPGKPMGS